MPSNPTRRSFIAASMVASAALSANDVLAVNDPERLRLIQRREYLQSEIAKLDQKWAAAYKKLPLWCRAGPKYRDRNGELFGPIVGWPEISEKAVYARSDYLLIRAGPRDFRTLLDEEIRTVGRQIAVTFYSSRMRELRDRLRERRQWHMAVGLPKSSQWVLLDEELERIETLIS